LASSFSSSGSFLGRVSESSNCGSFSFVTFLSSGASCSTCAEESFSDSAAITSSSFFGSYFSLCFLPNVTDFARFLVCINKNSL
jgi:hypothetical protein